MQMIHPLHAGAVRPIAEPTLPVEQRAVRSKTRVRRRQLARSALLLLLSATMLCGMVIWRRDNIRLTATQAMLAKPMGTIQARVDQFGSLPGDLRSADLPGIASYAGVADRFYAVHSGDAAIIAFSNKVPLILRPSGRYVIVYHQGRLFNEWRTEREFNRAMHEQAERMAAFEQAAH